VLTPGVVPNRVLHKDKPYRGLGAMYSVVGSSKAIAKDIPDYSRYNDERDCRCQVKRLNDNGEVHHMCPLNEVNERLSPPDEYEQRPHEMRAADEYAESQSCFTGI
jgi:hypothetical protein